MDANQVDIKIICPECQEILPSEFTTSTKKSKCPKCESSKKEITIKIIDSVSIKEGCNPPLLSSSYS